MKALKGTQILVMKWRINQEFLQWKIAHSLKVKTITYNLLTNVVCAQPRAFELSNCDPPLEN